MNICFNETLNNSSLENDLILCEKYGYDSMEIRLAYLKDYLETHSIEELKEFFDTHHIKPFGYNSIENINFCTPDEWAAVKELFLYACEASKVLGGKSIVVVPTCTEAAANKSENEVFEDSVRVLKELSDLAEPYAINIAFEPIGHERFCVRSTRQGLDIINAVNRENVGLALDAFNLYAHNAFKDIDDIALIPKEKMVVFHIDDAMDKPFEELETVEHRAYPGDGIIPVKEMCEILRSVGYDSAVSLELFADWVQESNPEDVIKTGYEKTKAMLISAGF